MYGQNEEEANMEELSMYINGLRHSKVYLDNGSYLVVYFENQLEQSRTSFNTEQQANDSAEDWVLAFQPQ